MLIDRLLALDSDAHKLLKKYMPYATFLKIQNAVDFFYHAEQDEWHNREDFPVVVPPWPVIFAQWAVPSVTIVPEGVCKNDHAGHKQAALILCEPAGGESPFDHEWEKKWRVRWWLSICAFFNVRERHGWATYFYPVDEKGQIAIPPEQPPNLSLKGATDGLFNGVYVAGWPVQKGGDEEAGRILSAFEIFCVKPILLALTFTHCKNVTLSPEYVPQQLQKKRAKAGRVPITKIYNLNIDPMRKIIEHTAKESGVSIPAALHICRGHFKDFRDSAGLFGKYRGLYWWDMQLRGSVSAGRVRKSYSVEVPDRFSES